MKAVTFAIVALALSAGSQAKADSEVLTGSMLFGRGEHTATLLPNGKVLAAGGFAEGWGDPTTAELYDPASGTWSYTGSLSQGRDNHTATLLPNGKVIVTGGAGIGLGVTAELYDPASGTWSNTGSMMVQRTWHTATLLPNGKVLVTGGVDFSREDWPSGQSSAELYDPVTASWTPTGPMNIPRYAHTATLLTNGQVLVTGGLTAGTGNGTFNISGEAELYDSVSGTWRLAGPMHAARFVQPATLLPNGTVLVNGGGSTNADGIIITLASAELYDPVTGTWELTGSMGGTRASTATLLRNGKVLAVSGASAEIYDPLTGIWAPTLPLHVERVGHHTATLLPDGAVLIAGGYGTNYSNIAVCELYYLGVNSPPTLSCPQPLSGNCGEAIAVSVQVADADGDPLAVVWWVNGEARQTNTVPAGVSTNLTDVDSSIPHPALGTNIIEVVVSDGSYTTSCTTTAVIVDTAAPVISDVTASPSVLWPPNHQMVPVEIRASAVDDCGSATWQIIGVSSNEPRDGETAWKITGPHTLLLRAERDGGSDGRKYYITVQATDASGNLSPTKTVTVTVPKSQGNAKPRLNVLP